MENECDLVTINVNRVLYINYKKWVR